MPVTVSVALQISPNPELENARAAQVAQAALSATPAAAAPSQGAPPQAALPVSEAAATITSLLQNSDADGEFAKSLIALLTYPREPK